MILFESVVETLFFRSLRGILFATPMVIAANKLIVGTISADIKHSLSNAFHVSSSSSYKVCLQKLGHRPLFGVKPNFSFDPLWPANRSFDFKENRLSCFATETEKDSIRCLENYPNSSG